MVGSGVPIVATAVDAAPAGAPAGALTGGAPAAGAVAPAPAAGEAAAATGAPVGGTVVARGGGGAGWAPQPTTRPSSAAPRMPWCDRILFTYPSPVSRDSLRDTGPGRGGTRHRQPWAGDSPRSSSDRTVP